MPHAIAPHDAQDELDNLLLQQVLDPQSELDFNRELEPGEKADDAIDFEDIDDDDLAEDEDEKQVDSFSTQKVDDSGTSFGDELGFTQDEDIPGLTSGSAPEGDGFDDLFGDTPSSPMEFGEEQTNKGGDGVDTSFDFEDDLFSDSLEKSTIVPSTEVQEQIPSNESLFRPVDFGAKTAAPSKEELLQQELFAMSRRRCGSADFVPAPPENRAELLASLWPKFEANTIPRFTDLLPPKKARYIGKTPLKIPKPLHLTKVSLELAPDQEKSFKITTSTNKRSREDFERQGLVEIVDVRTEQTDSEDENDVDSDYENERVGDVTWQDFQIVCEDWDVHSLAMSPTPEPEVRSDPISTEQDELFRDLDEEWERRLGGPPTKKQKSSHSISNILNIPRFRLPPLHDPEQLTSKIAKSVVLDLNDPRLLLDGKHPAVERISSKLKKVDFSKGGRAAFSKGLSRRYNISNDEAYDLLKENHQSKVRSTLGNVAVSHSMPALRLQWPYYKTKLGKQEARSFHRPTGHFRQGEPIMFSKPRVVKRKHLKGKDTQAIFHSTKDLSLGDNSSSLLLEYSEEHPAVLSNFGMGSRIINYYRRKNMEDTTRPKLDIGETAVLLPQDKSPFSIFGHIDSGQITPALHNSMYRAPIFQQEPKSTDFLMIRSATGVEGATWYLRNIEHIRVAGQQFPSVDVPGPHSRKVTTASKNRLKMIAYRLTRHKKPHQVNVKEITAHFIDSSDMQNRQKLKEFMQFSKETKEWEMRPGEAIPDEEIVRTMVKPEDVCLLEAMQVGQQHLLDAGFTKENDESDDDEGKESQSIEQQLAPWYTSRNFLNAASGKAMLQLHGEGDPTGRGEAFSFLKTSMKGGFKAVGESVEDKLDAKKLKELGGHSYNVAKQQKAYEESIRRIWDGQKQSLSSNIDNNDTDMDNDDPDASDDVVGHGMTPRSEVQTPAGHRRRDDETMSQLSKLSADSQSGKVLRITWNMEDKYGNIEPLQDIVRDPRVIRQYLKRRHAKEDEMRDPAEGPTGDLEKDKRAKKGLEKELARLEKNKDRRIARNKQKGDPADGDAGSPNSPASPGGAAAPRGTGTQRKCANCGQVGHIKTNKKSYCPFSPSIIMLFGSTEEQQLTRLLLFRLCPMLNGTAKQEDGFSDTAFAMGAPAI
ncbi:hypothetical protein MMC13_002006 [Lambiella insularis]|nr:hypothetical protein [Lambiella insularis]